ncbi:MAG: nucleotidyl transferase AbiEii/AbiGii toxin family protein [Varibaculum cambriense]|nr:nucleotidyl transferase AbiEii/AbiGii toxin family protein [Varibaculum cambriense]
MKMNNANQLKSKIKNQALQKGVDPRVLIRIYMMERFLDRVARSKYRERFVLKGGMLISYLVGVGIRTTMDIDTPMRNLPLTEDNVRAFIADVLKIDVHDGITFRLVAIELIMEEAYYPGFRVTLEADFDNIKTPVKLISLRDIRLHPTQ